MTTQPQQRPTACNLDAVALADDPIRPAWILDGTPVTRSGQWSASGDGNVTFHIWDCTAGRFRWHFHADEIVYILEGSVTVTTDDGHTITLSPGDAATFPAGSSNVWTVPTYVRKYAVLSQPRNTLRQRFAHLYNRLSNR